MRFSKFIITACCITLAASLFTGCGRSYKDAVLVNGTVTTPASTYLVEYIPDSMMPEAVGKTTFQLRVRTRSTGAAVNNLSTLTLNPIMHMNSGMTHSTPVDSIVNNNDGTYDCTVYYLMSDHMMGSSVGHWQLDVNIGSETATFYPSVGMAMPMGTVNKGSLYGPDDAMTANTNNYFLFVDGASNTKSGYLYISHGEEMNMMFMQVSLGSMLASPTGAVNSISVQVSPEDNTFAAPLSAANITNGHWSVDWSSLGLSSGAHNIYVRMTVNGQDKTKNGGAGNTGTNVAAFNVTL